MLCRNVCRLKYLFLRRHKSLYFSHKLLKESSRDLGSKCDFFTSHKTMNIRLQIKIQFNDGHSHKLHKSCMLMWLYGCFCFDVKNEFNLLENLQWRRTIFHSPCYAFVHQLCLSLFLCECYGFCFNFEAFRCIFYIYRWLFFINFF